MKYFINLNHIMMMFIFQPWVCQYATKIAWLLGTTIALKTGH